jgi:hypothetical protein
MGETKGKKINSMRENKAEGVKMKAENTLEEFRPWSFLGRGRDG